MLTKQAEIIAILTKLQSKAESYYSDAKKLKAAGDNGMALTYFEISRAYTDAAKIALDVLRETDS